MEVLEIGSHFHWSSTDLKQLTICKKEYSNLERFKMTSYADEILVSSGRQAIRFALKDIEFKTRLRGESPLKKALIPYYSCYSVIDPFIKMGYEVHFYSIDSKMEIKVSELNRLIEDIKPSVLLFHPYYGFNTISCDEDLLDDHIEVIFDNTQSFMSGFDYDFADYIVCSLRKWSAFPDGAYVAKRSENFICEAPINEDHDLVTKVIEAYKEKEMYFKGIRSDKDIYLSLFADASEMVKRSENICRMNTISIQSLRLFVDQSDEIQRKRRNNYQILHNYSGWCKIGTKIFQELPEFIVPLYFPLRVTKTSRRALQLYLAENNIYCPIIWPKPDNISWGKQENSHSIASSLQTEVLCFPIDQRYGTEDMLRILSVLSQYRSEI